MATLELRNSDKICTVDDEDYDRLNKYKWYLQIQGYAIGWTGTGSGTLIHRMIMDAQPGQEIDHINRDKLDNRKENLRFVTHRQNLLNRAPTSKRKKYSQHLGVCRKQGKWYAQLCINGECRWLGSFATEKEAAQAYVDARLAAGD